MEFMVKGLDKSRGPCAGKSPSSMFQDFGLR